MNLSEHIHTFIDEVRSGRIEIYNEFSLQHELGFHLRSRLSGFKVQFERNVSHFALSKRAFVKREIDISVTTPSGKGVAAIELKYPRNGQVPESMYGFCKDIAFLEQLVAAGFTSGHFLAFADDKLFYSGSGEGIYGFFRSGTPITGTISKPTGSKDSTVHVAGPYVAEWVSVHQSTRLCHVQVADSRAPQAGQSQAEA